MLGKPRPQFGPLHPSLALAGFARFTQTRCLPVLAELDRFCAQFAAALHSSELQIYAVLGLCLLLTVFLFPPRDDFDQV